MAAGGAVEGVSIRDAAEADLEAITRIYAHFVLTGLASFEETPPDRDEMRRRFAAMRASGHPYLVAEEAGTLAGYAYAGPYRPRPAYRNTVENSVYVAPDGHRRGVGSALLAALIAACERGPWRQMVAVIGDSANAASIGLHARHGFALVGTLKDVGFKHGRWLDTVLMQRALGPGSGAPPSDTR